MSLVLIMILDSHGKQLKQNLKKMDLKLNILKKAITIHYRRFLIQVKHKDIANNFMVILLYEIKNLNIFYKYLKKKQIKDQL